MPELGDQPIEDKFSAVMIRFMRTFDEIFNAGLKPPNKKVGVIMLTFEYGETEGRCNYISNGANRQDVIVMLKEQVARFEGQPEVKGHA